MSNMSKEAAARTPQFAALVSTNTLNTETLNGWLKTDESKRYGEYLDKITADFPPFDYNQFLQTPFDDSGLPPAPTPPEYAQVSEASAVGDLATVKRVLEKWDRQKSSFSTAYWPALKGGHIDVAIYLVEQGVEVKAIHFSRAMEERCYSFMQAALDHGYDINDTETPFRPTPLAEHLDDEEMTRWLLDRGADPNKERAWGGNPNPKGETGETSVSKALWYAPFSTIQLLFERGGPDTIRCGHLLWYAAHRHMPDRMEVMEYLLKRGAAADVRKLEYEDRPEAAYQADFVFGRGTPLHAAASAGHLDTVKLLVAWGADPALRDSKGRLPISNAQAEMQSSRSANSDHEAIVEYLTSLAEQANSPPATTPRGLERL
ncbi:MAG: hypothetical protein Q9170_002886 [Blastenia crenularia]